MGTQRTGDNEESYLQRHLPRAWLLPCLPHGTPGLSGPAAAAPWFCLDLALAQATGRAPSVLTGAQAPRGAFLAVTVSKRREIPVQTRAHLVAPAGPGPWRRVAPRPPSSSWAMATPDVSVHMEEVVVVTTPDTAVDGSGVEEVKTVLVTTNLAPHG